MNLPHHGLVEHHEREAGPCEEAASPSVVRAVHSLVNLIEVISTAATPLIEVVLVDVVGPYELIGVTLCLVRCFTAIRALDVGPVVHVIVIDSQ